MIHLRSKQPPRRDWSFATPLALTAVAAAWLTPQLTSLSLVYLHPLVGLWILDREIARSRPTWQANYRLLLCLLPVMLIALWWRLAADPIAAGDGPLAQRITQHAGTALLPMLPGRPLVATHVFLELMHYGVWLLAIPLASRNVWNWKLNKIPIVRRSTRWRAAVISILAIGGLTVIALWVGFTLDYALARDLYFTVAMLHVLAEIPFLLRSL